MPSDVTEGADRGVHRAGQPTTTTVECAGLRFTGASVSAHTTFLYSREMNLIFDVGSVVEEMLPIDQVLITHAHQDHLLGLTRYVGLRRLQRMNPPLIVVPSEVEEGVRRLFGVWQELETDGARNPPELNLLPAAPGDEVKLARSLVARAFRVKHSLPSLGYTISKRVNKLLPEYHGRSPEELAALTSKGVEIALPHDTPLVTFIGDTEPGTLDDLPKIGFAPVLIVECTFLHPDHLPLAEARGHLHIQHLSERLDHFGDAHIVLTHFSRRYRRDDVLSLVANQWPESARHRVHLLV